MNTHQQEKSVTPIQYPPPFLPCLNLFPKRCSQQYVICSISLNLFVFSYYKDPLKIYTQTLKWNAGDFICVACICGNRLLMNCYLIL